MEKLDGQATQEPDYKTNPEAQLDKATVNGQLDAYEPEQVEQVDYAFKKYPVPQVKATVDDEHDKAPVPQVLHVEVVTLLAVVDTV